MAAAFWLLELRSATEGKGEEGREGGSEALGFSPPTATVGRRKKRYLRNCFLGPGRTEERTDRRRRSLGLKHFHSQHFSLPHESCFFLIHFSESVLLFIVFSSSSLTFLLLLGDRRGY